MLEVTVRFDASAERSPVIVELYDYDMLTPQAARAARTIAAPSADVVVFGSIAYRVTDSSARRIKLDE